MKIIFLGVVRALIPIDLPRIKLITNKIVAIDLPEE
jgi:hypothetical protein